MKKIIIEKKRNRGSQNKHVLKPKKFQKKNMKKFDVNSRKM